MIVCDLCKSEKCFKVSVIVIKEDPRNKAKKKPKEIITIPIDLCDSCLTLFNSRLGSFCRNQEETSCQ